MVGRFEYKYEVDHSQVAAARAFAQAYCVPDPHGDRGRYEVGSLYFDTWDSRLAEQTIQGQKVRHKVRLRSYGTWGEGPFWAEIKRRAAGVVIKERAVVDGAWAEHLLDPRARTHTSKPSDAAAFRAAIDRDDLRPKIWVRYQREAFVSPFGDAARLTIDSEICAQPVPAGETPRRPRPDRWQPITMARPVVLELKFRGSCPAWMQRLARAAALPRCRFSKYVQSSLTIGELWFRGIPWMP